MSRPPPPLAPLLLALVASCADSPPEPRLSYERCTPGEECSIGTACLPTNLTSTGALAHQCTVRCTSETTCPGVMSRCIAWTMSAVDNRCARTCATDAECRPATRCRLVVTLDGMHRVCVPDLGPRACVTNADCAPFRDACERSNADGGAAGRCTPTQ